jgi:hypothetical protein
MLRLSKYFFQVYTFSLKFTYLELLKRNGIGDRPWEIEPELARWENLKSPFWISVMF